MKKMCLFVCLILTCGIFSCSWFSKAKSEKEGFKKSMEHLGDLINKVSKRQGKSKVLSEADVNLLKESLKPALALVKQNKAKLINALPEEHKGAVEALEEFEKNSLQSDKAEKIELEQVTSLKNEVLAVLNKAMKKISK